MKRLPVGIQDFGKLRKENFLYVDKTKFIHKLITESSGYYFLSRPRRFGKSLLVSTLQSLFEGKKDLFKDLWIEKNTDWKWEKHPVIVIDFNRIDNSSPKALEITINNLLTSIVKKHELNIETNSIARYFGDIIIALHKKYDRDVVILIDEYDKPIINHLGTGEEGIKTAKKNRAVLKKLFGVLKGNDVAGLIKFIFITGITKFARVSIFSDLNNLNDLSVDKRYAGLLGYTEDELETCFHKYIEELAEELEISYDDCKKKLRDWYNGYRFTDKNLKVYNPFSILNVLEKQDFRNYWFESATPTFLVNVIKENSYSIINLEHLQLTETRFMTFDIENLLLEPLLFQTGYITITGIDDQLYTLTYPNREVRLSFIKYLYQSLINIKNSDISERFVLLQKYLKEHDMDTFIKTIDLIFSAVPYVHIKNQDEHYYHTMFYLMVAGSGAEVQTEVLSRRGRLDMAVLIKNRVYVMELKCNETAEAAIKQIKEKGYAHKYTGLNKEVYIMGINIDTKARSINEWKIEKALDF